MMSKPFLVIIKLGFFNFISILFLGHLKKKLHRFVLDEFWLEISLGPKKFGQKNCWPKKFGSEFILGKKNWFDQKIWVGNLFGSKKNWVGNLFG